MKSLILALSLVATQALASQYPPSYCYENAFALSDGPTVNTIISSGCAGSVLVMGYRNSGKLAASNPDSIDAVVTGRCMDGSTSSSKITVVKLGREYHGTGYMSGVVQPLSFMPSNCELQTRTTWDVAYSDGHGGWDKASDTSDFHVAIDDFYAHGTKLETTDNAYNGVSLKIWDFIIDQMRK